MANKIIKGLAIAAGTGLAIGSGNNRSRPESSRPETSIDTSAEAGPDAGPAAVILGERLGSIERRLSAIEARPRHSTDTLPLSEIEARFASQSGDIAALRVEVTEHRQRVAASVAVAERRFAEMSRDVPALLESVIGPHVTDLRARLVDEIQESVDATLADFERTIDQKVSLRIATLEKALVDQSGIITALSQRAIESDTNLQRLISAVEKLCERTEGRAAAPAAQPKDPSFMNSPFETHLNEAVKRPPQSTPAETPSGFWPSIVKEDEERKPRHRMARL